MIANFYIFFILNDLGIFCSIILEYFRMENPAKIPKEYNCFFCYYNTCSIKDYNKHIQTNKHKNRTKLNNLEQKNPENPKEYKCDNCNKSYKARNSLWYHQQKCSEPTKNLSVLDKDELIITLLKQNAELIKGQQDMMIKLSENGINNNNHSHNTTTHTNSHNKAFNLNFFLNETCKDAMNITDFVDSIKLQLSDLESVGKLGYVEGISNIIVKNLKELDVTQRPVHCTDKKRETMYVKHENKWEKDEEKQKLHKVVRKVTCKNQNLIPQFKEIHPDCGKYNSKFSDQYNKIIVESMGGQGNNDYEKEEKIIKNISKQVCIDKEGE